MGTEDLQGRLHNKTLATYNVVTWSIDFAAGTVGSMWASGRAANVEVIETGLRANCRWPTAGPTSDHGFSTTCLLRRSGEFPALMSSLTRRTPRFQVTCVLGARRLRILPADTRGGQNAHLPDGLSACHARRASVLWNLPLTAFTARLPVTTPARLLLASTRSIIPPVAIGLQREHTCRI